MYLFSVFLIFYISKVFGFNIDINFPLVYKSSGRDWQSSYFGYSVAFHQNNDGKMLLVTAPKASTTAFGPGVIEPGMLYKCLFKDVGSPTNCVEVEIDRTGNNNIVNNGSFSYEDFKNNMWLGVSMDVQRQGEKNVVVCAHLWKNQKFSDYKPNGVCYFLDKTLMLSNVKKLLPFVDSSKGFRYIHGTQVNYYSYSQFGISSTFSQDEKYVVIGAPGFYEWTGAGVGYIVKGGPHDLSEPVIPNPPFKYKKYPYIGYSVTTGHFFGPKSTESVVLGAPRDAKANGMVYIIDGHDFLSSKAFTIQAKLEGKQMGGYFGFTVLAVNVNNDSHSDLLVGAPLFSLIGAGDEGRVYLYLSDGVGLQPSPVKLMGSKSVNSRFGSAIARIGDLDQDGYEDVAIGAPYENDRGAVYIYNGCPASGLKPQYSQRIFVSEIAGGLKLKGFGISIAKSMDIDDNLYQDLLIGAHESGNAILLRSKPIVRVESELSFDKNLLGTKNMSCSYNKRKYSCVEVKFCIRYAGGSLQETLELQVSLMSDTRRSGSISRGFFVVESRITQDINQTLFVHQDNWSCHSYDFYIQKNLTDFSAVAFLLSHKLPQKNSDSFCKNCPIMSKDNLQFVTKKIKFYTECENGVCVSDLTLSAKILNYQKDKVLIIGQNTSLTLEVQITNQNDPAYYTEVFISLPPDISVTNQGRCSILNEENKKTLQCDVGNPLIESKSETFQVKLDTSKLTKNTKKVQLNLSVTSQSREERPLDNKANLTILFTAETYVTIIGFTKNEQILFGPGQPDKILFEQGYVVTKVSPSPIELVNFVMSIPTTLGTKTEQMLYIRQVEVGDGSNTYVSGNCDLNAVDELSARHANGFRKDTPADDMKDDRMHHILNCQTASCRNIYCYAGPFLSNKKITKFLISAEVDTKAIEKVLGKKDVITIVSMAKVWIPNVPGIDPTDPPGEFSSIKTRLVFTGPLLPKTVATWIYILSIIVGILLLVLLCYGMYRIGFFRRKKHEYLEKMMKDLANKENIELSTNSQDNLT